MKRLFRCTLALLLIALTLAAPLSQVYAEELPFVDVKPDA